MKRFMIVITFCWSGAFAGLYAQAVVVKVRPVIPLVVRPVCPGPGHIWIDGYWRWDIRYRRNIWINGHWARVQRHRHYYRRGRAY